MTNLLYSQKKPQEQKSCFQGIAQVFFYFDSFVILNAILNFFLRFYYFFNVLWQIFIG